MRCAEACGAIAIHRRSQNSKRCQFVYDSCIAEVSREVYDDIQAIDKAEALALKSEGKRPNRMKTSKARERQCLFSCRSGEVK